MGNAAGTKDEYRRAKGSEQGLAGVRLQNALPRARIVYESATGATKPENLSYASRLGLWGRSEEHTSELQSLMRISYAVFCLKKKKKKTDSQTTPHHPHRLNLQQHTHNFNSTSILS